MLAYLGLPYMTAPGEAEAQCVELEALGLVDGIITDDSDVWVFGGKCVYRNMFSNKKDVHRFSLKTIKDQLGIESERGEGPWIDFLLMKLFNFLA